MDDKGQEVYLVPEREEQQQQKVQIVTALNTVLHVWGRNASEWVASLRLHDSFCLMQAGLQLHEIFPSGKPTQPGKWHPDRKLPVLGLSGLPR